MTGIAEDQVVKPDADGGVWGVLAHPIRTSVPDGMPPWKDNAYMSFWDTDADVFATAHVSTSPNAQGRRARFSVSLGGRVVEVVEELEVGTFTSESISFEGTTPLTVDSPRVQCHLVSEPTFGLADYTPGVVLPPLVKGEPLVHYQRSVAIRGTVTVDGQTVEMDGVGWRDRTWGYRDESANMEEYLAFMTEFPDHSFTMMRFRGTDGTDITDGWMFPVGGGDPIAVKSVSLTRNASSLFAAAEFEMGDGSTLEYGNLGRRGGFWAPMGWERKGPTIGEFDEFSALRSSTGSEGFGMISHGILRRMF